MADHLNKVGWTIINAECTRSAYRYATWDMIIAYPPMAMHCNATNKNLSYQAKNFQKEVKNLSKSIVENCSRALFRASNGIDSDLANPVSVKPMSALAYFHAKSCEQLSSGCDTRHWAPFSLKVGAEGYIEGDGTLETILSTHANELFSEREPVAVAFAEMDTDNANVRLAPMAINDANRLVHIVLEYDRRKGESSKGLVASVLRPASKYLNLYRISNLTKSDEPLRESGVYQITGMLTRNALNDLKLDRDNLEVVSRDLVQKILAISIDDETGDPSDRNITIRVPYAKLLSEVNTRTYVRARNNSRHTSTLYDVFLSHSWQDNDPWIETVNTELNSLNIVTAVDSKNFTSGEPLEREIIDKISDSRELLVLASQESMNSAWVHFEIGIARAQGKPVRVILKSDFSFDNLPKFLIGLLCEPWQTRSRVYSAIQAGSDPDFI